jgi:hypothetical protein
MESTCDAEIMTSSAIGMSLVSAKLPNWPHCSGIQQLQAHRQERFSTMSEISIYRALFPRQMLFIIIIIYYSQSVTPCPVLFQLLCSVCLFYSWCSFFNQPFKVSSSCAETYQSTQQLYFTSLRGFLA